MKFKELVDAVGPRKDWISFVCDWNIQDDGNVRVEPTVNITLDTEIDIHYQWFHHCNPNFNASEVWDAIEQHDYDVFYKWYEKFVTEPWTYLPSTASIYAGEKYIGDVCIAWHPDVFSLINSQDHECG